jgi:hypothetical protein
MMFEIIGVVVVIWWGIKAMAFIEDVLVARENMKKQR